MQCYPKAGSSADGTETSQNKNHKVGVAAGVAVCVAVGVAIRKCDSKCGSGCGSRRGSRCGTVEQEHCLCTREWLIPYML